MKQDPSFFEGHEPALVYIAKRLREALKLESVLTAAGIDYGVEPDHYTGGIIFRSQRVGAFFYVRPDAVEGAQRTMQANGYRPYHAT